MSSGPNAENEKPASPPLLASLREYSPYLTLGFQLAAAVVVFLLIGVWLDSRWETSPWFTLSGLLLGTTGGFIKFFTTVSKLDRNRRSTDRDH